MAKKEQEKVNLDDLANELIAEVKDNVGKFKSVNKLSIESLKQAFRLIEETIVEVEKYSGEIRTLTGTQKKEVVVKVLNKLIDIPWVPEFIEEKVISFTIDRLLDFLNRKFGIKWIEKI